MPGGLYEAGNVSYGIPVEYPTVALYLPPYLHPARLLPHPLTSSAASLPTPYSYGYFTLRVTLPCLCPSVPVALQRHEYEYGTSTSAGSRPSARQRCLISINQPHYRTVPHTSTVLYCTVLAPPR